MCLPLLLPTLLVPIVLRGRRRPTEAARVERLRPGDPHERRRGLKPKGFTRVEAGAPIHPVSGGGCSSGTTIAVEYPIRPKMVAHEHTRVLRGEAEAEIGARIARD